MTVCCGASRSPRDLRALPPDQPPARGGDPRRLIDKVSRTGGHLGPTSRRRAHHRPAPRVPLARGRHRLRHRAPESYVHKMLTGRLEDFDRLRQEGGLSGYPSRDESPHDVVENSPSASTALSWVDGIARASSAPGSSVSATSSASSATARSPAAWPGRRSTTSPSDRPRRHGRQRQRAVVLADHRRARVAPRDAAHDPRLREVPRLGQGRPRPYAGHRSPLYDTLHGRQEGPQDVVAPQGMFEDLGLQVRRPVGRRSRHRGPRARPRARQRITPARCSCVITEKGRGYLPAELDDDRAFHAVGVLDPETGQPLAKSGLLPWTSVFSDELVAQGRRRPEVVAVTAAMMGGRPGSTVRAEFPDRTYDVGIAEQHAATSAAGMAYAGLHRGGRRLRHVHQPRVRPGAHGLRAAPRASRSCSTVRVSPGDDGASHNGMWDMSILQVVPGLRIAAPRDAHPARGARRGARREPTRRPCASPRGRGPDVPRCTATAASTSCVPTTTLASVLLGRSAPSPLSPRGRRPLAQQGIAVTVVDPRWVVRCRRRSSTSPATTGSSLHRGDNSRTGGIGSAVAPLQRRRASTCRCDFGIERRFLHHASRSSVLAGPTAQDVSRAVVETVARFDNTVELSTGRRARGVTPAETPDGQLTAATRLRAGGPVAPWVLQQCRTISPPGAPG